MSSFADLGAALAELGYPVEQSGSRWCVWVSSELFADIIVTVEELEVGCAFYGVLDVPNDEQFAAVARDFQRGSMPVGIYCDDWDAPGFINVAVGPPTYEALNGNLVMIAGTVYMALQALSHDEARAAQHSPGAITAGTYQVPLEIEPGLYRYQGYYARLGYNGSVITNGNANGGWGLFRVWASDDLVETDDVLVPVTSLPSVDPVGERFRDGVYLVGVDVAPGSYELVAPGGRVYFEYLDKDFNRIDNHLGSGRAVLEIPSDVFAVGIKGLLAPLAH